MDRIDWRLEAVELVTCNCDFGCPCQFNSRPTHGNCHAAACYRIEAGEFGGTDLAGVTFVGTWAWPGAIHEGAGQAQLYVDDKASQPQRDAVQALFRGEHTDPGATIFNVFSTVIDIWHDTVVAPINFDLDLENRHGRFEIPGWLVAHGEPIRNPVTGHPHRARVTLPEGFEYNEAEYGAGSTTTTAKAAVPLSYSGSHAHFARLNWTPAGVVRP